MTAQSPTITGFKAVLGRPSAGLFEIAWRWGFGTVAVGFLIVTFVEFLGTLPATPDDLQQLRNGRQPLVAQAVWHILRGSGPRLLLAATVVVLALTVVWVVMASVGRLGTLKLLSQNFIFSESTEYSGGRLSSLVTLNLLRALIFGAATLGLVAAAILVRASAANASEPSAVGVLLFLILAALVWAFWSSLNRILNLASLFVVADGEDALAAFGSAVNLYSDRRRAMLVAGTWFGLSRFVALVVAASLAISALGLSSVLPIGLALLGALLVVLIYFAIADYLHIAMLAAYLAISRVPENPLASGPLVPLHDGPMPSEGGLRSSTQSSRVDPDELILSDLP
jgi:hypothetical protein